MRRPIRDCPYCNISFFPNVGAEMKQVYCTEAHRKYAWKKRNWRNVLDYDNARRRRKTRLDWVEKICVVCNKQFLPPLGNKYAIYCSIACRIKINTKRAQESGRKKINAGKFRQVHKLEIRKHNEEYKARINFGVTSKTLNKTIVLKRDNKTCQLCEKPYQVIHHIRYSGKPEDLICLCRACHARLHSQFTKAPYWNYN